MGTLAILRSLLTHIQSEGHPVYLASRRISLNRVLNVDPAKWGAFLFLILLLLVPIASFMQSSSSLVGRLMTYHDQILDFMLFATGSLLSLAWTIPFAALSGQGISQERALQTWDTLRTTPYSMDVLLLAKAAADIRFVWGRVVTTVLISVFMAFAMIATTIMAISQSFVLGVILVLVTVVAVVIERMQEVALSALIGISVSLFSGSHRLAFLLGLLGGTVMRLLQLMMVVGLATYLAPTLLPQFSFLCTIVGTSVLVAVVPGLLSVVIIVSMIVLREILIRQLFGWAVRHAYEG